MKIFLIGMPASGKTTLGKKLAAHLQIPFIDLDDVIVKAAGKSIKEVFEQEGEDHFRELERDALQQSVDAYPGFVMATGGGTPCFFDNMEVMKKVGTVVFLNTSLQTIQARLAGQEITKRPLMKDVDLQKFTESFKTKFEQRMPVYEKADVILNEKQHQVELVINTIQNFLKSKPNR